MANLKNTIINSTGFLQLPAGNSSQRQALAITIRGLFNNTLGIAEDNLALTISGNGTAWERYRDLPNYLRGLRTTLSINDTDGSTWDLPACRVYMIRNPAWNSVDITNWTLIESERNYITGYGYTLSVYYRDFAAGSYTFDNNSAMYMFDSIPTAGTMRWNTSKGAAEFYSSNYAGRWENLTVPFLYRTIITNAYVIGGYKDSVTWRNVNRTVAATDTTTDLGDQIERSFNYKSGLVGLDRVTVFGAANAHATSSNISTMFNMRTETSFTTPTRANMANSRGHSGSVFKEHLIGWITGGANSSVEGYFMTTDTIFSTGLTASAGEANGPSGEGPWGASDENYGIWYTGEAGTNYQSNFNFQTQTLSTRSGTQVGNHYQQKTIYSKVGRTWAGNEGSWAGGYTYRRTNFVTNTSATYTGNGKATVNCGEENFTLGQDWQYQLGQYNGAQNNISAKFVYATEVQTQGGSGLEPKGPAGRSSAVCGWRS